ncbi:hypothetical protein C3489_08130 [Streptomyces sp. Ru71]|uniref:hypothetical protein n=1 Tax=Streptomyces sp. Ru71 TaxID=2080746 RepID=UPI000CDDC91F|nr:hypothetical protein [Streptomyces sp. Ru71]POX55823.1 hypothetical protein C3489_08130 [Streptomyces sp. Ru71]
MAADANSIRITGKVQGRDIVLTGPMSKDEIRDRVWWWQLPATEDPNQPDEVPHVYDDSARDVIAALGGYYEVPRDPHASEASDLIDMLYTELHPGE